MEETELEIQTKTEEENQKSLSKSPTNLPRKAPNEKKATIIIGVIAAVLALSLAGTFIGAAVYQSKQGASTSRPSFNWDTDRSGFYDKDGKFLGPCKSYKFLDKKDSADNKYIQITSFDPYEDSYSFVFPSSLNIINEANDKTENFPIYAVGKEIAYDDDSETTEKNIFGGVNKNKNIGEVYFQSLYKEIGDYAFYQCEGLEKVEFRSFASGKQTIGKGAFAECSKLKNVVLSNNLASIGEKAFENNTALTTIELPGSLTSIGSSVFKGSGLRSLKFKGTEADWNRINKASDWSEGLSGCYIYLLEESENHTLYIQ